MVTNNDGLFYSVFRFCIRTFYRIGFIVKIIIKAFNSVRFFVLKTLQSVQKSSRVRYYHHYYYCSDANPLVFFVIMFFLFFISFYNNRYNLSICVLYKYTQVLFNVIILVRLHVAVFCFWKIFWKNIYLSLSLFLSRSLGLYCYLLYLPELS